MRVPRPGYMPIELVPCEQDNRPASLCYVGRLNCLTVESPAYSLAPVKATIATVTGVLMKPIDVFKPVSRAVVYPMKLFSSMPAREAIRFITAYHRGDHTCWITPRGLQDSVCIRPRSTDLRVLYQMFGAKELDFRWPLQHPPMTAIDAGANVGYATLAIKNHWPQCRIVALEPDAANFEVLKANCKRYSDVQPLQAGLWGTACSLELDNQSLEDGAWGLRFRPVSGNGAGGSPAITVGDAVAALGTQRCDFLKIDIEGAEEDVFAHNVDQWIDRVSVILVELHGQQCHTLLNKLIAHYGFEHRSEGEKYLLWRANGSKLGSASAAISAQS